MKIRKISVIGVLIIVSLVVTGIAVVNSWKKSPYGTLHINAALLQKVIEFKNIDLFGENKTPMEIRKTTAESRGLLQKKPTPVYQVTNPANMNTDSYRQFADGFYLSKRYMEKFRSMNLPRPRDWQNPYALAQAEFTGAL